MFLLSELIQMKKITFFLIFLTSIISYSQGEANYWYFGENAGINFNTSTPTPLTDGKLNTREGCSSFSDASGNLLFYSDGTTVWNKNHTAMPNGTGLKGHPSSTQSAMIIPKPNSSTIFYIFTVGARVGGIGDYGFNYYTVDMTADGGLGDVIAGPEDLSKLNSNNWSEKVAAIKGNECDTFWVVSYDFNNFYAYKVSSTGVNSTAVISNAQYTSGDKRGYLKISPDGKKLAIAHMADATMLLYDFNDITGEITNKIDLPLSGTANKPYGVEFSASSQKLYVNASNDYYNNNNSSENNNPSNHFSTLFQFDVSLPSASEIAASRVIIDSQNLYRGALQLGPNQKIYRALSKTYSDGIPALGVIESPDKNGLACNYQHASIPLAGNNSTQGLPPFIASLLLPVEIVDNFTFENLNNTSVNRCIGENYTLTPQNIQGTPMYKWTFNNAVISNSATLNLPNLTKANEGSYYLEIDTTNDCGVPIHYTGEVQINVYNPPTIAKPIDILECDTDNDGYISFDLNNLKDVEILNGQSTSEYEVLYYTTQNDADANTNIITGLYTNKNLYSTDTIFARIQHKLGTNCYKTESFTITVFESPNPPATITNLTTCDTNFTGTDTDGFETFDLTQKETEILNGQPATDFTISYFTDATYTNSVTDKTAFKNTTKNKQPIYVQITNNANANCTYNSQFTIEVFSLPSINPLFTFKQCDDDGTLDGITNFNLNEANDYLTFKNPNLKVTYHLSTSEAIANSNQINPLQFSNNTQTTVYARIENTNGCYRVSQVNLLVSATHFNQNYLKTTTVCDDDAVADGYRLFDLSENDTEIINQFPTGQNLSVSYYTSLVDAQLEQNAIDKTTPYKNEVAFNQIVYVRVESEDNGECFGYGPHLNLVVNPRPEFEIETTAIYCLNLAPITIEAFNANGNYTYIWKNENEDVISTEKSATISKEGTYNVVATSLYGCESFKKNILIEPSVIASISYNDISITDDSENNSITINTSNLGIGDYEFSLDDIYDSYQDDPQFLNVQSGIHTLYIRDKNNCGIAQIDVSVIGYPKFFTPNNDGYNDYWYVRGFREDFYPTAKFYIFDRFGKIIANINPNSQGWDGTYNGEILPASDYWFTVELIDKNGNIRTKSGHFSLIRR